MWKLLIPSLFLSLFGFFNLFGIKKELLGPLTIYVLLGFILFFAVHAIGINFFRTNAKFFYWFFIALLIATFIIGVEVKGSKRWIDVYFFRFQVSEFFKPFFVVFMADFLTKARKSTEQLKVFLISIFYFIIPAFIIFKQPDLGNALVYTAIYIVVLLFSAIPKRYILYVAGAALVSFPVLWFLLQEYQRERLTSFINPTISELGTGYNMIQAIITVGSGKLLGRGLGYGTQSKLFFLPENHTDFAFSSMVEQFGFIGGGVILILFLIIILSLFTRARKYFYLRDDDGHFKLLYVLGLIALFMVQISVNIGMNMGLLPITGITLPFISYGGSSYVTFMVSLGLLP